MGEKPETPFMRLPHNTEKITAAPGRDVPRQTTVWRRSASVLQEYVGYESAPRVTARSRSTGCRRASARLLVAGRPNETAKAEMAGRGVHGLRHAGGRPVAAAIVRRAKVRASLHHSAWNANP